MEMTNPIFNMSFDITNNICGYLTNQYLNTSTINKAWNEAYTGPKTTSGVDKDSSVEQYLSHLALGHGRGSHTPVPGVYVPVSRVMNGEVPSSKTVLLGRKDLLVAGFESGLAIPDSKSCAAAASVGDLETLMYLKYIGTEWDEDTTSSAAHGNHFEVLEWAIQNGCPSDNMTMLNAASNGNLAMVYWLYCNDHVIDVPVLLDSVFSGCSDIIMWANGYLGLRHPSVFSAAVEFGDIDILEQLCSIRYPWLHAEIVDYIAKGLVDEDTVKWLNENGYTP